MKLSHRLVLFSMSLITIFLLMVVMIINRGLHARMVDKQVEELTREAQLVATRWLPKTNPQDLAVSSSAAVHGRVTLIDSAGIIVGDALEGNPTPRVGIEARRPEIRTARAGGVGVSIGSEVPGEAPDLYVAVPARGAIARVAVSLASLDAIFDDLRRDILSAGLVALMIATLLSYFVAQYVSNPIIQLRDRAQALARRDYGSPGPTDAPGEVGQLADSLQQLSNRLETLELLRRDFIANVSHELLSPLSIASGFAATLAKEDPPPELRREFAKAIVSNTARMQRVIDELLDLSRIETGRWVPRPEPTNLSQIVDEVFSSVNPAAASNGVVLITDIPKDAEVIYADRVSIRVIVANLTENAVRHTTRGSVTVFSRNARNGISIGVRDTGEGISPHHLPRIFERFYKADRRRVSKSGGSGLGLAIVKHMIEAHGGTVDAQSTVGVGTSIRVFFPTTTA
jgi:signal transduction histidine kinase